MGEKDWNPDLYLKYGKERIQPSIDLVRRIELENPKNIIDIGCGPGNSTQILGESIAGIAKDKRWASRVKGVTNLFTFSPYKQYSSYSL